MGASPRIAAHRLTLCSASGRAGHVPARPTLQVQRYYLMKRKHPNLFRADGVDRLAAMMAAQLHAVLDGRDADGCPVLTVKIGRSKMPAF